MSARTRAWRVRLAVMAMALAACAPHAPAAERARDGAPLPTTIVAPAEPWAADLARFDSADRTAPPAPGGVLFVGSSSIRLWTTLATDFPGVPVLNRGFGGSELADVARLAHRLVVPYRPRVVVLYAGDNDIAAGKLPAEVYGSFRAFVDVVHRELPGTPIVWIAIKPSLARWALIDRIRATNKLVGGYAAGDTSVRYVDVYFPMLDSTRHPRAELFREDGLHMTPAGYALWRRLVAPALR